ncbi:hypothetical protein [Altererythrobacter sp. MF3-039]|uniref:DUF6841 family protein n=1 Tax=Altererythrobacter sp. MF3-039 TaxID=3252901 RepID=UPI00390C51FE
MLRTLLALTSLLLTAPAAAQEREDPVVFITSLLEHFNEGDMEDYAERFAYPHGRVLGDAFTIIDDRQIPLRTYDVMRASGWAYSRFNEIEVLEANNQSALLRVNFSRFNEDDVIIQNVTAYYTLVLKDGSWKIVNLLAVGQSLAGMQMDGGR